MRRLWSLVARMKFWNLLLPSWRRIPSSAAVASWTTVQVTRKCLKRNTYSITLTSRKMPCKQSSRFWNPLTIRKSMILVRTSTRRPVQRMSARVLKWNWIMRKRLSASARISMTSKVCWYVRPQKRIRRNTIATVLLLSRLLMKTGRY